VYISGKFKWEVKGKLEKVANGSGRERGETVRWKWELDVGSESSARNRRWKWICPVEVAW
jgi:hypothetical protein